jgi:hypothetical protein
VNEVLPQVAKQVFRAYLICYVDINKFGYTRPQFGIDHNTLPAIAVSQNMEARAVYPEDEP